MKQVSYRDLNARNIFDHTTDKRLLLLCIDALDYDPPRLKVRCAEFDADKPECSRITNEVDAYIPIGRFLVLAHDITHGVIAKKKRDAEAHGMKNPVYFEQFGGDYPNAAGTNQCISRRLALVNGLGSAASFAFLATAGPGAVGTNGMIKPIAGVKPTSSIFINMPDEKLKEFALVGKMYIEQFAGLRLQAQLDTVRRVRDAQKQREINF